MVSISLAYQVVTDEEWRKYAVLRNGQCGIYIDDTQEFGSLRFVRARKIGAGNAGNLDCILIDYLLQLITGTGREKPSTWKFQKFLVNHCEAAHEKRTKTRCA